MKLIKITFKSKASEIDAEFESLPETIQNIYNQFFHNINYSEFTKDDISYIYTSIDSSDFVRLLNILDNFSGEYLVEDISKEALYGKINTNQFEVVSQTGGVPSNAVSMVINSFIDNNLNTDIVLEKITDLGRESLVDKDIEVLENGEVLEPVLPFKFIVR